MTFSQPRDRSGRFGPVGHGEPVVGLPPAGRGRCDTCSGVAVYRTSPTWSSRQTFACWDCLDDAKWRPRGSWFHDPEHVERIPVPGECSVEAAVDLLDRAAAEYGLRPDRGVDLAVTVRAVRDILDRLEPGQSLDTGLDLRAGLVRRAPARDLVEWELRDGLEPTDGGWSRRDDETVRKCLPPLLVEVLRPDVGL